MSVEFIDHRNEVMAELNQRLGKTLEAVGIFVTGEAQDELENSPRRVDTGNLQNSISHKPSQVEKAVYIGTDVEYALYVHEGTSKMMPNHFLRNAVERNRDQIKNYFEENL